MAIARLWRETGLCSALPQYVGRSEAAGNAGWETRRAGACEGRPFSHGKVEQARHGGSIACHNRLPGDRGRPVGRCLLPVSTLRRPCRQLQWCRVPFNERGYNVCENQGRQHVAVKCRRAGTAAPAALPGASCPQGRPAG